MSRLCKAVVFLLLALPACARAQAFETVSIKPSRSTNRFDMRIRVMPNGDFSASAVHVYFLLRYAYDVPGNASRFSMPPTWRELHDIEAKAPANAIPAGLSEREKWSRVQLMLRALLADRFKLVIRTEQKTMPVYALVVASGGPKLQKSPIAEKDCFFDTSSPDSCHNFIPGRGHPLNAVAIDMEDLVQYVENWTDLPVVNKTNLRGLFAVQAGGWRPMQLPPRPPGYPEVPNFDDLPTLFTVLGKLGLELKKQEAAVPVYTVTEIKAPAVE